MLTRKSFVFALFAALLLCVSASRAADAIPTPTDDLRKSIDGVIEVLAKKDIDRKARRDKVVTLIHGKFDFEAMGRFILGVNWKAVTPEQRAKFVQNFERILDNTYMNRIEAYTDEKVRYVKEDRTEDKARILTNIVSKGKEIPVEYKVYLKGQSWYVYDVNIEGVSLVRNYQESYNEIFRKEGMDGLLKKMAEKATEMEASKGTSGK